MSNIRFTTKAAIMDGIRYKAIYSMDESETLSLVLQPEGGVPFILTLKKGEEHYTAARAAYDEKTAKRTAGPVDRAMIEGMKLDGGWFRIAYEKDIDRCTVTFKKKPSPEIRELVKAYGFWWAPSHKCWSRKINSSAWWAGQELYKKLTA